MAFKGVFKGANSAPLATPYEIFFLKVSATSRTNLLKTHASV